MEYRDTYDDTHASLGIDIYPHMKYTPERPRSDEDVNRRAQEYLDEIVRRNLSPKEALELSIQRMQSIQDLLRDIVVTGQKNGSIPVQGMTAFARYYLDIQAFHTALKSAYPESSYASTAIYQQWKNLATAMKDMAAKVTKYEVGPALTVSYDAPKKPIAQITYAPDALFRDTPTENLTAQQVTAMSPEERRRRGIAVPEDHTSPDSTTSQRANTVSRYAVPVAIAAAAALAFLG